VDAGRAATADITADTHPHTTTFTPPPPHHHITTEDRIRVARRTDPERTSVTEIPEHLLKRSRERRSALGLGGDDAGGDAGADTPAASAPAKVESTAPAAPTAPAGRTPAPAPAAPPPPKPDIPVVAAYKRRKKIPFWAMAALSIMPIWALMYARAVTEQPEEAAGPLGMGAEVYSGCAGCHGPTGGGGAGYAFTGGEVLQTFPHIEDQLRYVYFGTAEYNLAGVDVYGNPDREGGAHVAGALGVMPQQGSTVGGSLTDYEILAVVCHERYALGGADPAADFAEEFETWCSEESEIFLALEGGSTLASLSEEFDDVAPMAEPIPGSPG
jgi:mono/diheme cytochrome c family protein